MFRVVRKYVAEVDRCGIVGREIWDLRLVEAKHESSLISSLRLCENGTAIGWSTSSGAALPCRDVIRVDNFSTPQKPWNYAYIFLQVWLLSRGVITGGRNCWNRNRSKSEIDRFSKRLFLFLRTESA